MHELISTHTTNWNNGLWYAYSDHLKNRFGEKVYKLTVSAGFTCPTRDGTRGTEGCAFCDGRGSASYFSSERASLEIKKQLQKTENPKQKTLLRRLA